MIPRPPVYDARRGTEDMMALGEDGSLEIGVLLEAAGTLPEYGSAGAAGADLRASESLVIAPGGRAAVPTGVRLALPPGHVGLVWPRSGLAVKHGIDTLAGVIDNDYRGELRVVLVNHGEAPFAVAAGDRVAQLLLQRVERARFAARSSLEPTERGGGGFGSTGR